MPITAKFVLQPGEQLIGQGWMAYWHDIFGSGSLKHEDTKVHVTNHRIFCAHWMGPEYMDIPLSHIRGFQVGRRRCIPIPKLTIYCRDGTTHIFIDFRVQKLRRWLLMAGVEEYPAEQGHRPPVFYTAARNTLYVLFALWVIMGSFPTGLLYDLGAGHGTEPGQRPSQAVHRVVNQGELVRLYDQAVPATAKGRNVMRCPLLYSRDALQAGADFEKYCFLRYPLPRWQTAITSVLMQGQHNYYHLLELEDGSWLCVYFDDYLMFQNLFGGQVQLPAGRVRKVSASERNMLKLMTDHHPQFQIESGYILDTYRYGKVAVFDIYLRLALAAGGLWLLHLGERTFIWRR